MSDVDLGPDWGAVLAGHLDVMARVGGSLDEVARQQARANNLAAQAGMLTAAATVMPASASCPSNGAAFAIDIGGPAQGRLWDVRRLVVGGVSYSITAAGAAWAFITASAANQFANYSLAEWLDYAATLPLNSFYGASEATLRFPEHLVIVVTSGTANQLYMAAARVVDRIETPTTRSTESVGV